MNSSDTPKRLRQTSLFESFTSNKRKRSNSSVPEGEQQPEILPLMDEMSQNTNQWEEEARFKSELQDSPDDVSEKDKEKPCCSHDVEKHYVSDSDEATQSSLNESFDLFPNSPDKEIPETNAPPPKIEDELRNTIEKLIVNKSPLCSRPLAKLWSTSDHTILFNCNFNIGTLPKPYPPRYKDSWDDKHVRLPCSPSNKYPVKDRETGNEMILSRWEMIEKNLLRKISSSLDLEEAILSYNTQYAGRWNFLDMHKFFTEVCEPEETNAFFENLLPKMVNLALRLPELCTSPIPLLRKNFIKSITLSQLQIGSLLANAFFCTFPRRNSQKRDSEYSSYPSINFNKLFTYSNLPYKLEKFKCVLNYFMRITKDEPTGILTFERRHTKFSPCWSRSQKKLTKFYALSEGLIEKEGAGLLQVDFANKFVGGGVLGHGCVQEEIRFLICPELIVARLFTESLNENEVLLITGCEQFNAYSGYGKNFKWEGNFCDETPHDTWGRRCTQVLAMDALPFHYKMVQYEERNVLRELNKAFSGFYEACPEENLTAIATGNWGCGVFNGDSRLKALIQLLAASESNRDLVYFTFGDDSLKSDVEALYDFLKQKEMTVGDLCKILFDYGKHLNNDDPPKNLYSFIYDYEGEGASNVTVLLDSDEL